MRLSPWLAPLKSHRTRINGRAGRGVRRRPVDRLSPITERLEARTLLTSFFVNTHLDTVDIAPGDDDPFDAFGRTSLRSAIMEANAQGGSHQIFLEGGQFNLTLEGSDEDAAAMGDLDITANVQIFGGSSFSTLTTIINAQHIDRVFEVRPGAFLQLQEVEITGGDLRGRGDGGAIRVDGGNLQATNVSITENRASNGGAISNNGGFVTVTSSVLANNHAEGGNGFSQGGAIESNGGTVTITRSAIHDNRAQSAGGGIAVSGGTLDITNSTIAQNSVGDPQSSSGDGGGIYIQAGVNATLLASTIAFNSAGNQGGGIWTDGSLTIERTLISNNMTNTGVGPEGFSAGGTQTSSGYNLIREDTGFAFTNPDVIFEADQIGTSSFPVDPNLAGLGDNGGFTPTIAFFGGSPAIDAGPFEDEQALLSVDQRGFSRIRDGDRNGMMIFTDIGAFEQQSPSDFFVDDAGDYLVTNDQGALGTLDDGDTVTFDPGGANIAGLIVGERAFTTIADAVTAARASQAAFEIGGDLLNEVVLGPGTYSGNVLLDVPDLLLRGHSGLSSDTIIDAGGATFGLQVTASGVQLDSLRVTNAVTGVGIASLGVSTFQASNIQVDGNSGVGALIAGQPDDDLEVQIRDSNFTGNSGDGLNISNSDTVELRNVTASSNGGDGISISNVFETALDTVTVSGNVDRGFNVQNAGPVLIQDPRTSANTNGNDFNNVPVFVLNPVVGDVSNSVTVTDVAIQFDAGADFAQQALSLSNVNTVQITTDGGNDSITVDYSGDAPDPGRQLFLDGGFGTDQIQTTNDAHHKLDDSVLSIAAVDEIQISSFEKASITGGAGNNNLNANNFEGQVTLSGGGGNDTLEGSAGDDSLNGGTGDDVLLGGPLEDQYVLGDTEFEALDLDSGSAMTILDETDTDVATVNLGTDFFRFNDVEYAGSSLFVSPSGLISFNGQVFPQDNFDLTNVSDFVSSFPIIAPLFDDWVTGITSFSGLANLPPGVDPKVLFLFEDTDMNFINDRLIIEWNDVYHRDQIDSISSPFVKAGASPVTFQVILELNTFDRDGDITFNYVDLDTGTGFANLANGASATVGGKDGGDNPQGVRQVSFNEPNTLVGDSRAIIAGDGLSDGDDVLNGGDGDDVLVTSSGRDSLDGGSGAEVAGDRLVYDGLRNPFASDHLVNNLAIESRIFEMPDRFYEFKAEYTNFEELELDFGPADQNITVDPIGLPSSVSIDTRGPSSSDTVTIKGTAGNDVMNLSGTTLSVGGTTIDLAGVEDLILDLSGGGADSVSVDQTFSGSARNIRVVGDAADDSVSLQSTANPQLAGIFDGVAVGEEVLFNAHLNENRGGGALLLEEAIVDGTNQIAPDDVVISPDGSRVYVAAFGSDSLVVYDRDRVTGDLTFVEALVNGMDGVDGLNGATNVAVSADGQYIYVTSENPGTMENDGSIASFVHHPGDNQLTFISSTTLPTDLPTDVTLTPGGEFLLVTAIPETGSAGRVMIFGLERNGDPQFVGSLDDGGLDGGGEITINGLAGAEEIAISPDGQFFYVTALDDNSVTVFSRPGDDNENFNFALPLFIQKVTEGDSSDPGPVAGLDGASSLTISPDGLHLYVTGEDSNAITLFDRNPGTGMLTFVESLTNGVGGGSTLATPTSVSISPDGQLVYVAAETSNAISVFDRNGLDGKLTFRESLQSGVGDTDTEGTVISGLTNVFSLTASDDGLNVYAVGTGANSIVRFNTPRQLNVLSDGEAALSLTTSGGDDMIAVGLEGLPVSVSIDAGGSVDSDQVNVFGTATDDTVNVNGGTLTFGSATLTLTNAEALNLATGSGDDTVNVTASVSGPQLFVDGGLHATGDVLNVDAVESQAFVDELEVLFSGGFQSVGYSDVETIAITNASPTIDDNTFVIAENSPITTPVGTANASDPEIGETLTWTILSGNDDMKFAINSSNGDISVNATLDFEVPPTAYSLIVEVEDTLQELTDTATITINVTDVEPAISDQTLSVFDNQANGSSVGTVALDPGDMNSVNFSIFSGNIDGTFSIDSSSGLITVANSTAIVPGAFPFVLTVQVDDGDSPVMAIVAVTVMAPPPAGAVFDDAVDSGLGTLVGSVASLDNGPGDGSVSIPAVDAYGQFADANYTPVGDDPADTTFDSEVYFRFGNTGTRQSLIDASGANGSSIRSLSDEANSSFTIGDLSFALTQTLEPVFDDVGNQNGTLLTQTYRIQNVSEIESQTFELVRYVDGDLEFDDSITEGGGRLQLPTGEDLLFETDLGTSPDTSTAFLGITGLGGTIPEIARFQIEEYSELQAAIINGDPLADSLSNIGAPVDNNGDQFVDAGLEFDLALALANSFALGASQSAVYTTHTLFGTDSPTNATGNTAPTITPRSFSVDENSSVGTSVGIVTANDDETPTSLAFAITAGDPDGFFAINSSTGEITIAKPELDHEAAASINLTVEVTDPGSLSASATVTVDVNDLNDAPVFDTIGNQTAFIDQELAFTVTATDPDDPPSGLIFSLGTEVPGVSITPSGDITFTPTSTQRDLTFFIPVIVTESNVDELSASASVLVSVLGTDFGDAPDSYGTTLEHNGPRHFEGTLFLGDAVDTEDDGQPDEMASGDDNNSTGAGQPVDDEDGITFLSALSVGTTRLFRVSASEPGFLDAWIDFDRSGVFDLRENLSSAAVLIPESGPVRSEFSAGTGIAVPAGFSTVSFEIPNDAMIGETFARFRLSSSGGLTPTGLASDGEVEDHLVEIVAAPVGNSDSLEAALDTAVDEFFDAFADELNDPDPTIQGDELPLAVQAENGATAERTDGDVQFDVTDPLLRGGIDAINNVVAGLEQARGRDENIFVLALHPVDFILTDPRGRTFGSVGGTTTNNIGANATYSGDGVVELLTIRNADSGQFGLQLIGVGGVFRGGSSLITPSGTQQVTFQGSLTQAASVDLALNYQDGALTLPSRTDLEKVDFSQIADIVAGIPTAESQARTLAAGATEALASIALDRLDAAIPGREDDPELSLEELLERLAQERKRLLEAIETSLDDDDLENLKRVFGDTPEDADSAEILTRVLLETLSGPLISVPRQVNDISGSLQQLLEQLREQQRNQNPADNNTPQKDAPNSDDGKGEAKSESDDKRTSQRVPVQNSSDVVNSVFIVNSGQVASRRKAEQTAATRSSKDRSTEDRQAIRGPKVSTTRQASDRGDVNVSAEAASEASPSDD